MMMGKKREMMIGIVVVVVGILIGSVFAWSLWGDQDKGGGTSTSPPIHHRPVAVAIDSEDNLHIVLPDQLYIKTGYNGSLLDENGYFSSSYCGVYGPGSEIISVDIAIDQENNVHIVSDNMYFKYGSAGALLTYKVILNISISYHTVSPVVRVDGYGNTHILLNLHGNDTVYYIKLDKNGNITAKTEIPATLRCDRKGCMEIDSENKIHIIWPNGSYIQYRKIDENGTLLVEKMLEHYGGIAFSGIDKNNKIYVFDTWGDGIVLTTNGTISSIFTSGTLGFSGRLYSFFVTDEGNLYFLGYDGDEKTYVYEKFDSNGSKQQKIYSEHDTDFFIPQIITDSNSNVYTIYFLSNAIYLTKIDDHGNVLISEKKVWEYFAETENNADSYETEESQVPQGMIKMNILTVPLLSINFLLYCEEVTIWRKRR